MRYVWLPAVFAAVGLGALADQPVKRGVPPKEAKTGPAKSSPADLKSGENLIPNGDFEEGDEKGPKHWQIADGLCSYWVKDSDPKHGMVMKFDTDVYQREGYAWWVKIANGASPKNAPKKTRTVGDKYDTIAGNDGTWFWSDYVPVKKGKAYWLTMEVKGPGAIMAWLVGYPEKGSTAFGSESKAFQEELQEKNSGKKAFRGRNFDSIIAKYVWKGQLSGGGGAWSTLSRRGRPFRPTINAGRPNGVKYVRVLIYPFWPPGEYYVDNVKLTELSDDDPRQNVK